MDNTRRSFIKNSALIAAGASILPYNKLMAADTKQEKFAIQLYSVDRQMNDDAIGTLQALKKIGYRYVEHANYVSRRFYGFAPSVFRSLLDDCGLGLLGGHSVLQKKHWQTANKGFTKEWHHTIEDAAIAGQKNLITPWLEANFWKDENALKGFMEVFNESGELCKRSGLQFGYHNHGFEFTQTFGALTLFDVILQHTDPALVAQQLDIGNIYQVGFSARDLFAKYPGRFPLMHIKDMVENDDRHQPYKSTVIGDGGLKIGSILQDARNFGGTTQFVIEQDDMGMGESLEHAKRNFAAYTNIESVSKKNTVLSGDNIKTIDD